ncbi:MAG: hypothetical protein WAQ29_09945, partial [Nitrososphaeraceae archaeon]
YYLATSIKLARRYQNWIRVRIDINCKTIFNMSTACFYSTFIRSKNSFNHFQIFVRAALIVVDVP